VLRTLSLCTCRRTTPVQRTGALVAQACPSVSAFPETTIGSVCTSSFSRIARRSFTLRPAHSRGDRYPKASDISSPPCLLRLLPAGAVAGRGLHPLKSAALSRPNVLFNITNYQYLTAQYPTFGQYGRDIWRRRCASLQPAVDLRSLPLSERRKRLQAILPAKSPIVSEALSITGRGCELLELMCSNHLEGIAAKRLTDPYEG